MLRQLAERHSAAHAPAQSLPPPSPRRLRRRFLDKRGVPLAAVQVQYSLLSCGPLQRATKAAADDVGATLIAYSPLALGLLAGAYSLEPGSRPLPGPPRGPLFKQVCCWSTACEKFSAGSSAGNATEGPTKGPPPCQEVPPGQLLSACAFADVQHLMLVSSHADPAGRRAAAEPAGGDCRRAGEDHVPGGSQLVHRPGKTSGWGCCCSSAYCCCTVLADVNRPLLHGVCRIHSCTWAWVGRAPAAGLTSVPHPRLSSPTVPPPAGHSAHPWGQGPAPGARQPGGAGLAAERGGGRGAQQDGGTSAQDHDPEHFPDQLRGKSLDVFQTVFAQCGDCVFTFLECLVHGDPLTPCLLISGSAIEIKSAHW